MRTLLTLAGIAALFACSMLAAEDEGPLLMDMAALKHKPQPVTLADKTQVPAGTVELVDGKFGKACKFTLVEAVGPQLFTAWVNPQANWDDYEGFSFWVKGDGSKSFGGLEFIDGNDYALRYGYCFLIDSKEWVKVTVPWSDLTPEISAPLVDAKNGYAPSKFRNVWIGKWVYWRTYPACSFAIEKMTLEKKIDRPAIEAPKGAPLARVLAKLKAGQPVTIVTMGDSLTDKRHWANREKDWNEELAKRLEAKYKSKVTLVNPAIGGTTLSQNMVLIPRWADGAPSPDLVTVCFGFNDWDSGVRGPRMEEYYKAAVDRIRRATKDSADVLIMTTCPAFQRWDTFAELCRAEFAAAKDRGTGLADISSAFHKAGTADAALKRGYWAWDNTHMGPAGHDLIVETVLAAIESEGQADLKAAPDAWWMKPAEAAAPAPATGPAAAPGTVTLLSSFEPDKEKGVYVGNGVPVKEHATEGEFALKLTSLEKDYSTIGVQDGPALTLVRANSRMLLDVFNPQDKDIEIEMSVRDPKTTDYNSRYNGMITIKPGKSTLDLDYTKLPRSGSLKADTPDCVDPKQITVIALFLHPHGTAAPVTLFIDNVRLVNTPAAK